MKKDVPQYKDFAIILTWPHATIRGDEKWMMFFKKIGIVKNLNFKVGHTGVVIVSHKTGEMLYYDFGRYISPRGYGRARSKFSDPRLLIKKKAEIKNNEITNLQEIVKEFESKKPAMYGDGVLYFSVARDINFDLAKEYGDFCVNQGTYPYGAVARNNNNCSRFITRMLIRSSRKFHRLHWINFPETIKASPISNVVNAVDDRYIYSYTPQSGLRNFKMNRWQSFMFLVRQLGDNVNTAKSAELPEDITIGGMKHRSRPLSIPDTAIYLGGVGDGAWYTAASTQNNLLRIERYTSCGQIEYAVLGRPIEKIDLNRPYEITYDSHLLFSHILQDGKKTRIEHVQELSIEPIPVAKSKKLYA